MTKFESSHFAWLVEAVKVQTDECMLWPFKKDHNGYGRVRVPVSISGQPGKIITTATHRYAFKLVFGRFPTPHGLHRCDNPLCFNPRHIFEGDYPENTEDKVKKNRQAKGSRFPHAKLTEADIVAIRSLLSSGRLQKDVAVLYRVSCSRISYINTRKNWKHVA